MAEYWKSQPKKYCEFCKCWIADNKPSIGFHESGKRHKENVTKRLSEISKNSAKSYKEELQVDQEMKKMEEEAFKAYMKDLQENPDYTSKKILEETERRKQELEESIRQKKAEKERKEEGPVENEKVNTEPEVTTAKVWYEAKSDEGYTYYWNTSTSESKWEPPTEGFVSLEDQEKLEKETKLKEETKRRKKEEKAKQKEQELKLSQEKEENKKKRKKVKDNEKEENASVVVGPAPKPDPYGAWTVIEPKVEEPLDLQLPEQEFVAIRVPEDKEPEIKFKEKSIKSLEEDYLSYGIIKTEEGSSSGFKKRKLNRMNMRQKLDTE